MTEYNTKNINDFFDKVEESVADHQTKIIKNTLDELFTISPHIHTSMGRQSNSEYDANHKISINNGSVSLHHGPTFNQVISAEMIEAEKAKAEAIECGDRVEIFNTTPHAMSVEFGSLTDPGWTIGGYYPYARAAASLNLE